MKKNILLLALFACGFSFQSAAQADLSLTGSIDNNDPGIYANVTITAVLTNDGPETAHNILCRIPNNFMSAGYGIVLAGSSADLGSYNWLNEWRLDSLESGATATLRVQGFTMKPQLPLIRGQVVSVDEDDPDSTPSNLDYAATEAAEDDEFVIDPMAPACDIEIEILSNECSNSPGFATVEFRVNTSNPAYERFQVARYSNSNGPNYQDVLPNEISTFTVQSNSFGNRLVATPFFNTDNCFDEVLFNAPNCNNGTCFTGIGFQTITCTEDALGEKFWSLSGTLFANQSGGYRVEVNGTPQSPNGFPETYYDGSLVGIGGTASGLDIASNPSISIRVYKTSGTCERIYNFNAVNYCNNIPTNITCGPRGLFPWHEWISRVQFDGIDNSSTAAQYTDYSASVNNVVEAGTTVPIDLTVKYSFITYNEYARVWIDYNADGEFSADEKAFDGVLAAPTQGAGVTGHIIGSINIPPTAKNGVVRMRIALKREGYAGSCERFANGEVEDYALTIIGGEIGGCQPTAMASDVSCNNNGTPNDASDDSYYFTLNTGGTGLATGDEIWLADGNDNRLNYDFSNSKFGTPFQVGPISIALYPTVSVRHVGQSFPYGSSPACTFPRFTVNAPATCSNGIATDCGMTATVSNISCDPGSFFTTQDDRYSFDVLIDGAPVGDPVFVYYSELSSEYSSRVVSFDVENALVGSPFSVGPIFIQNYPEIHLAVALPNSGTTCILDPVVAAPTSDCLNPETGNTADCAADSEYPWEDWISKVKVGDFVSSSGKSEYSDFRGVRTLTTEPGSTLDVELTTTFSWFAYKEYWRVWIDYNQDSIYTADEIAYEGTLPKPPDGAVMRTIAGQINIPQTALVGNTTMRIIMTRNSFAPPCGTVLTGEVEDYSVSIVVPSTFKSGNPNQSGYQAELKPESFVLYPNPTSNTTTLWTEALLGKKADIALVNSFGKTVRNWSYESVTTPLTQLDLAMLGNGVYTLRILTPGMRMVTKKLVVIKE